MYNNTDGAPVTSQQKNVTNGNPDGRISGSVDTNPAGDGGAYDKLTEFPSNVGQGSVGASGTDFAKK